MIQFTNSMASVVAATPLDVYTVPAGKTGTIFGLTVANTSVNPGKVSIRVGTTGVLKYIVKDAPLEAGGTLIAVGGSQKVVLTASQKVEVTVTNASLGAVTADVVVSLMTQ